MKTTRLTNTLMLAIILLALPCHIIAQEHPTYFLGFPVDGPKQTMIDNLQSLGYQYHYNGDYLTGYFYGEPVYIFLNTRDSKLNRVLMYDIVQRDSVQIKKRFNRMYKGYEGSKQYEYMSGRKAKISRDDNIAISVERYSKTYRVVYGQRKQTPADSLEIQRLACKKKGTNSKEIAKLTSDFRHRLIRLHAKALMRSITTTDNRFMNQVWFGITEKSGKYAIIHCFDNLHNFSQP